jgi:hypothetical protein
MTPCSFIRQVLQSRLHLGKYRICGIVTPPLWSSGQTSWLQIGDVLFPVRYELNVYSYVEDSRPPLWSSSQSSWLRNGDVFFLCGKN